jgi:hypothetical protein
MVEQIIEQIYLADNKDELHQAVEQFLAIYPELAPLSGLPYSEIAIEAARLLYLSQASIMRVAARRLSNMKEPQALTKAKAA